jgi:hypothetical protein
MAVMTHRCGDVPAVGSAPALSLPTSGVLRWVRGAVVGVAATGLAGAGHVTAGGASLSGTGLTLVTLVAVATGVGLSNRRWTTTPLMAMLLGAQVVFHLAFGGINGPAMSPGGAAAMSHALPSNVDTAAGLSMADPTTGMTLTGEHGAAMLAGHLLAALVTGLVLRRGEDWCWRLVDLLTRPVQAAALRPPPLPTLPRLLTAPRAVPAGRAGLLADVAPRRGPPAVTAG